MYSQRKRYKSKKRSNEDAIDSEEFSKKYDELVRHLSQARDEIVKYQTGLNSFKPWMDKARKKLSHKEKYLKEFDKIDKSTADFVQDVIQHQADLHTITQYAKNFINCFKTYHEFSRTFRKRIPSNKRARIESLCKLEGELSDTIASISSKYRNLLARVHALLKDELKGLNAKQQKYKEAVADAGDWLKDAERRANLILYEPAAFKIDSLEEQLNSVKGLNDEFILQADLINNAKKVLATLLRTLEGQLSDDDVDNLKNPFIDIEKKYNQLCQALSEKFQTLDVSLIHLKSQQKKSLSSFISTLEASMNDVSVAIEEFPQNYLNEDNNDKSKSSNNEHITKSSPVSVSSKSTGEPRNNLEEKNIAEPRAQTSKKVETKSGKELTNTSLDCLEKDLEEGECTSSEEKESSIEKDIETGSPVNQPNLRNNLLRNVEEISEDSFACDENVQERINIIPKISTNEREDGNSSSWVLLNGAEDISEEESFIEDEEEKETSTTTETWTKENTDSGNQECISLNGPKVSVVVNSEEISKVDETVLEENINNELEMPTSGSTVELGRQCATSEAGNGSENECNSRSNEPIPDKILGAEEEIPRVNPNAIVDDLGEEIGTIEKIPPSESANQESISLEVRRMSTPVSDEMNVEFSTYCATSESKEGVVPVPESNSSEALADELRRESEEQPLFERSAEFPRDESDEDSSDPEKNNIINPPASNSDLNEAADSSENWSLEIGDEFSEENSNVQVGTKLPTIFDKQTVSGGPEPATIPHEDVENSNSGTEMLTNETQIVPNSESVPSEALVDFLEDNIEKKIDSAAECLTNIRIVEADPECVSLAPTEEFPQDKSIEEFGAGASSLDELSESSAISTEGKRSRSGTSYSAEMDTASDGASLEFTSDHLEEFQESDSESEPGIDKTEVSSNLEPVHVEAEKRPLRDDSEDEKSPEPKTPVDDPIIERDTPPSTSLETKLFNDEIGAEQPVSSITEDMDVESNTETTSFEARFNFIENNLEREVIALEETTREPMVDANQEFVSLAATEESLQVKPTGESGTELAPLEDSTEPSQISTEEITSRSGASYSAEMDDAEPTSSEFTTFPLKDVEESDPRSETITNVTKTLSSSEPTSVEAAEKSPRNNFEEENSPELKMAINDSSLEPDTSSNILQTELLDDEVGTEPVLSNTEGVNPEFVSLAATKEFLQNEPAGESCAEPALLEGSTEPSQISSEEISSTCVTSYSAEMDTGSDGASSESSPAPLEDVEKSDSRSETVINETEVLSNSEPVPVEVAEKSLRDEFEEENSSTVVNDPTTEPDTLPISLETKLLDDEVGTEPVSSITEDMDVESNTETTSLDAKIDLLEENVEKEINAEAETQTKKQVVEAIPEFVSSAATEESLQDEPADESGAEPAPLEDSTESSRISAEEISRSDALYSAEMDTSSDSEPISSELTSVPLEDVEQSDPRSETVTNETNDLANPDPAPVEAAETLPQDNSGDEKKPSPNPTVDDPIVEPNTLSASLETELLDHEIGAEPDTLMGECMEVDSDTETTSLKARIDSLEDNLEKDFNSVVKTRTNEQNVEANSEYVSVATLDSEYCSEPASFKDSTELSQINDKEIDFKLDTSDFGSDDESFCLEISADLSQDDSQEETESELTTISQDVVAVSEADSTSTVGKDVDIGSKAESTLAEFPQNSRQEEIGFESDLDDEMDSISKAESASLENSAELPRNDLPEETSSKSRTLISEEIDTKSCANNSSLALLADMYRSDLEEDVCSSQKTSASENTDVEPNEAFESFKIIEDDLEAAPKEVADDHEEKTNQDEKKIDKVSFNVEEGSAQSQSKQNTSSVQPEDKYGEDYFQSNLNDNNVVMRLLKKHQRDWQPVVLLEDVGKKFMKNAAPQQSTSSRVNKMKHPKSYHIDTNPYTKDTENRAARLERRNEKKEFQLDTSKHPVSLLQEYCAYYKLAAPKYKFVQKQNAAKQTFHQTSVIVLGKQYTTKAAFLVKKHSKIEAATLCLKDLGLLPKN